MANKVTVEAKEMKNADVQFISLVKRSASRIPFRVLKTAEENAMINLNGLFGRVKKQDSSPTIAGIAIPNTADVEDAIAKVEELGLSVIKQDTESTEGVVVLVTKEDTNVEHLHTLKLNDNIACIIESVEKSFYGWPEGTSFSENMSQSGFFPGLQIAANTLMETIQNQFYSADAPPVEDVAKSIDEFKDYVVALAAKVPEMAFKLDGIELTFKEEEATEEETAVKEEETTEEETTQKQDDETSEEETQEVAKDDTEETDESVTKGDTEGEVVFGTEQEKLLEQFKQLMLDSMKEVTEKMDEKFTEVTAKIEEVSTQATEAAEVAKKVDEQMGNVVLNDDDSEETTHVQKKQSTGIFDSAFELPGFTD